MPLQHVIRESVHRSSTRSKNPKCRVELLQRILGSFWKCLNRDFFPLLVQRKKWNADICKVRVNDIVMVAISMQFMENVQLEQLLMLICDEMERPGMSRLRISKTSYKDCSSFIWKKPMRNEK